MRPFHEGSRARLLHRLADALCDHPWRFLIPQLLLLVICIPYTIARLEFSTNRADLVSAEQQHQRAYLEFRREFQFPDSLVAMVESTSQEKNRRFVERLASKLEQEPELFLDTYYRGDLALMGPKALLFLSEETLEELLIGLQEHWSFIETFSQAGNLVSLLEQVNREFREGEGFEEIDAERLALVLPGLWRILDEAGQSLVRRASIPAPGIAAIFGEQSKVYLTFAGGQIYAVVTHPASEERESEAVNRLRELVGLTQREVPGVNAGITGEAVLDHDEMVQARRDISVAAIISVVLVAVIFIYGYHEIRRPILATICLLVGIGYTLGLATLTVGRFNLLSITLVPILIGLAIDFGVHLITRFEEELRRGGSQRHALGKALGFTGAGIFTSGLTTAGAFLAMLLTEFKGIREMGLIAGTGLVVCLIPMMTLLPLLLVKGRPDLPDRGRPRRKSSLRAQVEQVWLKRPKVVLLCGVALTIFSITQFPRLQFDYNLLNLQSRNLPAVAVEEKLIRFGSQSLLYAVVIGDSLEHAMELEERLERLGPVGSVTSMVGYLTEDQERKLALIRGIKSLVGGLDLPAIDREPVDLVRLNRVLFSLQGYLGLTIDAVQKEDGGEVEAQLRDLRASVMRLRSLTAARNERVISRLTGFQQELFGDFHETVLVIAGQDDRERLQLHDIPRFLRERFISPSGKFLLQVYPVENVWHRDAQERFVTALRSVDSNVTGTVVQIYEYTTMLKESFQKASAYAVGIVGLIVLIHFRRPGSVALAFLPVLLGVCWMLGLMGFIGIPFNPVNIMALTLVIGIGAAQGVHILNRYAEEPHPTILAKSTGKAVLVSAITSMAGFGSLMSAKHQGIASLGEAMAIGTGMCMLASLTLLPAILNLLSLKRKRG